MNTAKTFVTQPSLAPLSEYVELLEGVWESGILTHNGPLVQQLERDIASTLGLAHFVAVSNGTIALQMAIRALGLKGEIITSPFTWVATVSAIKWEGCTPRFCDINPETLNLDPSKLEACITPDTVAIMPIHVFGNPCDVDAIQAIADKHGLKVIYDAAHAVGSHYNDKSLLEYGDISATSLHATKLLNTGEGGGCITRDPELNESLKRIRFFGHNDSKTDIIQDGFNGKMTEIHAALGLANLKYHQDVLDDRRKKYHCYREALTGTPKLSFQSHVRGEMNYSYFPVIFDSEKDLLDVSEALRLEQIFARRYFYPSVNTFNQIVDYEPCPLSESIAPRILCLPLFYKLEMSKIELVIEVLKNVMVKPVSRG